MLGRTTILAAVLAPILLSGAPAPARANPNEGYLHGTVSTRSGASYTGVLRWDDEELFWDDLFNSRKQELPHAELAPRGRERQPWGVRLLQWLGVEDDAADRVFTARFGDLTRVDVTGRHAADLTLRNGRRIAVAGGANDVGATITVHDRMLGPVELGWSGIDHIVFSPAPADAAVPGRRLEATVVTTGGELRGWLQWDSEECIDTDQLDGETRDGTLAIPMGSIARIERASERSATVTLRDGRTLELRGTNDVDRSIRGILVEDPRFGRVSVPWKAFEHAELRVAEGSGRGYASFRPAGPLAGVVHRRGSLPLRGQLIYDLDETEAWEMLDGEASELTYTIPMALVAGITPDGRDGAEIVLRSGETLRLENAQDVTEANAGVAVVPPDGGEPVYVPWERIERIELTP